MAIEGMSNALFKRDFPLFTKAINNKILVIVRPGNTWTGWRSAPAELFEPSLKLLGVEVVIGLGSSTGAARNSTFVILNETTGITLLSGDITLNNDQWNWSTFYSEEQIHMGDVIRVTIGNDGIGSGAAQQLQGYFFVEVNGVYKMKDV